jgi:hypothetical protein
MTRKKVVQAEVEQSYPAVDFYAEKKKSGSILDTPGGSILQLPALTTKDTKLEVPLDFATWLPFCAPKYHISPDPEDYVITPVIVMPSDLPNRNAVAFPLKELVNFIPDVGMQAYKTWKGKPTHFEHKNEDITKAYGVIVDSFLHKMIGFGDGKIWKLLLLLAFDRTKHPEVADAILHNEINSYSMGAWINSYTCSYCGKPVDEKYECPHLDHEKKGEMYIKDGILVFQNVKDIMGFECSAVGDPAFRSAISDHRFMLR